MKTKEEIAKHLVDITIEVTNAYFQVHKKEEIEKMMWAFLHIGFVQGMVFNGYKEDFMQDVVKLAIEELSEINDYERKEKR